MVLQEKAFLRSAMQKAVHRQVRLKWNCCFGQVEVSHKGDRFCFHIPQEGTVYVHDNTSPNEFIHQLVELVGKHGCTMNEILNLFHTYSENIITEEMNNGEFDRLIRFADNSEDPYYYCFKDEGCHIIYHRFLPEDYTDFDF